MVEMPKIGMGVYYEDWEFNMDDGVSNKNAGMRRDWGYWIKFYFC